MAQTVQQQKKRKGLEEVLDSVAKLIEEGKGPSKVTIDTLATAGMEGRKGAVPTTALTETVPQKIPKPTKEAELAALNLRRRFEHAEAGHEGLDLEGWARG